MTSEPLDDFKDVSDWLPVASGLARLSITRDEGREGGSAMRLGYDFKGGGGFVVARKVLARTMPETFALRFAVRGRAPSNRFELKLADVGGRNVWWRRWDAFEVGDEWRTVVVPSREIEFAWGPAGGGTVAELGAIELVVVASPGGSGVLWVAELEIEDRTYRARPVVRASSAALGHAPAAVLEAGPGRAWRSRAEDRAPWLEIDFVDRRELGGLVIDWEAGGQPRSASLATSDDGASWRTVYSAEPGPAARSYVYLPNTDTRFLRLDLAAAQDAPCGIGGIAVQPFAFSRSIHEFFEHVARDAPRGHHPRWLAREQSYWTSAGVPDGETCAIVNEEGAVEPDRGSFTLEPFLFADGRLVTWGDVRTSQSLADGWIPIPTIDWDAGDLALHTTVYAGRCDGRAVLFVRYRLESLQNAVSALRLFVAIRPFQVNPPWQAFGALGGTRRIESIAWDGRAVEVDGERWVVPLTRADGFGATAFERGEITSFLATGALPPEVDVRDAFGFASAALAFDLELAPGSAQDVYLAIPFGVSAAPLASKVAELDGASALETALEGWRASLGGVLFEAPENAQAHVRTARTAAAQVLVNRDGAALQPGPRRYTRSWIRDGAVMAAALLRFGRTREAEDFVRWYAPYQAPDGNVPCCVDRSGPDWLVEHDSHGELVFAIADVFRFTRDHGFLDEHWPVVQRAIAYMDRLRLSRLGPEYDEPKRVARRGLLPESASHEGYLAHPVHSYWDDFWALKAYRDAARLAALLGRDDEAGRIAESRDALASALRASIERVIAERAIPYVPGSVEWADFDPTATAVAASLLGGLEVLPREALDRTIEQYLEGLRKRRDGGVDWNNYSAYEVRIVAALVHLGRRDEAAELAEFLLGDRRPAAWGQWPEISWRDPRSPGHIGDVPHTWIGAEWALAFRSMLAYERDADEALVVAAGVPATWLAADGRVVVRRLPTYYGPLDLELSSEKPGSLTIELAGLRETPPGGIVVRPPLTGRQRQVVVDGVPAATAAGDVTGEIVVDHCPVRIEVRCADS